MFVKRDNRVPLGLSQFIPGNPQDLTESVTCGLVTCNPKDPVGWNQLTYLKLA